MKKYICIHGHFYQPPRENPWLEEIELQDSALPYHDWNERITAECYGPNRAARILDHQGLICRIVNNYQKISFNFGPTLLAWLERHSPETYHAILAADLASQAEHDGHGAALAQAYGHMILPLANRRDKQTQLLWGIKDFAQRFGRRPEGLWLPETAVDLESLDLMAAQGIKFTLLAPHQAKRIRLLGQTSWSNASIGNIDTRQPYRCCLPSGRSISIFFYHGQIAREVAFAGLLNSGDNFANRLLGAFDQQTPHQLVHIATDGESYGHHHRFGEMALAYAIDKLSAGGDVELTLYGAFLEKYPPTHEVEIIEETSWSCCHGIERWRADCGCNIGSDANWNQAWRAPLRDALDWLRDQLIPLFERQAGIFFNSPWAARDQFIDVVLDRSPEKIAQFFQEHACRELSGSEQQAALQLLETQRHAMLMYTSCGWFFDEVSGIETIQILTYAGRAIQLTASCCGIDLEREFLARLAKVPSNLRRWEHAGRLYEQQVKPALLDLARVAAHHAIVSLFEERPNPAQLYCYTTTDLDRHLVPGGRMQLAVGTVRIQSLITHEAQTFSYAALHYGNHHVSAGIRPHHESPDVSAAREDLCAAFLRSDIAQVVRLLDHHFNGGSYTLSHLFKDEQQRIVTRIIAQELNDILGRFRDIYEDHLTLLRFLRSIGMTIPAPLAVAVEQVINDQLRQQLESQRVNGAQLQELIAEADRLGLQLDRQMLTYTAAAKSRQLLEALHAAPGDPAVLQHTIASLQLLHNLPWTFDLWHAQNQYLAIQSACNLTRGSRDSNWTESFRQLGRLLGIATHSPEC